MKSLKVYLFLIGICCGAWWLTTSASASTLSDTVWVNGEQVVTANEDTETSPLILTIGPARGFDTVVLGLTEPDNQSVLSDLAWVVNIGIEAPLFRIAVASDLDGSFPGVSSDIIALALRNSISETGDRQDISRFFGLNDNTILVQSDITDTATPLPAALPLFAGGLGVIGLLARRRKRKAAAIAA
jgi:hypothetical protein